MNLIPHFTFDGHAEEALNFYVSVFKGKAECILRFKDFREELPEGVSEKEMNRIMYSMVSIGEGCRIAICDFCSEEKIKNGSTIFMDISYTGVAELKRVYEALAAGGKILMPMAKTSWSDNFASVIDKFGIGWNLMQEK